jgi:hypothetical protein
VAKVSTAVAPPTHGAAPAGVLAASAPRVDAAIVAARISALNMMTVTW